MRKVALLKRRFNRVKRRIALGQPKPGDNVLIDTLARDLGYPLTAKSKPDAGQQTAC